MLGTNGKERSAATLGWWTPRAADRNQNLQDCRQGQQSTAVETTWALIVRLKDNSERELPQIDDEVGHDMREINLLAVWVSQAAMTFLIRDRSAFHAVPCSCPQSQWR